MIKLFLHIGMPKTGTTYLQNNVFPKMKGVYYIPQNPDLDYLKSMLKQGKNIISQEDLSGNPYRLEDDRYQLADKIHSVFPDANIIFCTRKKDSITKSLYSQYIKMGGFLSYEDFIDKHVNNERFDYIGYISYLKTLFKNVYVYKYEDFKKNPQKEINKLCKHIGVKPIVYKKDSLNVSASPLKLSLFRFFNIYYKSEFNQYGLIPWKHPFTPRDFLDDYIRRENIEKIKERLR